jgi:hypothetical protein
MKKPIENRFLSYCYDKTGKQDINKYYFPEKNIVISRDCKTDCNNPKKVHTTTSGQKLYYINDNRDNNKCLDYFPIIKINFDTASSFDIDNKIIYKFFDNSSYPNKITNNGVLYTKNETDLYNYYAYFNNNIMNIDGKEYLNLYNSYAINILFKPTNLDGTKYLVLKGEEEYTVGLKDGILFFEYNGRTNYFPIKLLTNQHYHLFLTVLNKEDHSEGRLFINGILIQKFVLDDTFIPISKRKTNISIGKNFTGNMYIFEICYFNFKNTKIKEIISLLDKKTLLTEFNFNDIENSKKKSSIIPVLENNDIKYDLDLTNTDWSILVIKKGETKKVNNMSSFHLLSIMDGTSKIRFKKYLNISFDTKNSLIIYNFGDLNHSAKINLNKLDDYSKFLVTYDVQRQLLSVYLNDILLSKFNIDININKPIINFHYDPRLNRKYDTTLKEFKFYNRLLKPYDKTTSKITIKNTKNTNTVKISKGNDKKVDEKVDEKKQEKQNLQKQNDQDKQNKEEEKPQQPQQQTIDDNMISIDGCSIEKNKLNMKNLMKMEQDIMIKEKNTKDKIISLREQLQNNKINKSNSKNIDELEKQLENYFNLMNKINTEKICIQKFKDYYSSKITINTKNEILNKLDVEQNKMKNEHCNYLSKEMDKTKKIVEKEDNKRISNYKIDKNAKLWVQFDTLEKQFVNYNKKELKPSNSVNQTTYNYSNVQNDKLISNDIKGNNNKVIDNNNKKEYDPNMIQKPDFCLTCYDKNKKHVMSRLTVNDFDIREHKDFKKYTLKKYNCPK